MFQVFILYVTQTTFFFKIPKSNAEITLTKDGKTADCKKIFGLMGLAVKKEQEVVVTFDGEDEDAAYTKVSAFLEENM